MRTNATARWTWAAVWLLLPVTAWAQPAAVAEEEAAEAPQAVSTAFLRLVRDDDGRPVSLQTSTVRYTSTLPGQEGVVVDLIGALHVGEQDYYDALDEQFEQYDALLYELVAPQGTRVPAGGGEGGSTVSSVQSGLKDLLELEFQLEQIDYQRENFVHADMSPDDFAASMEARGESVWSIFFRLMGQGILQDARQRSKPGDGEQVNLLALFFAPDRAIQLKRLMAQQFDDTELSMIAFEGPEGSTIISERNKVALKVLREQLDAGKQKLAIFYGAGHMPDMDTRLREEFKMQPGEPQWIVAWDLRGEEEE